MAQQTLPLTNSPNQSFTSTLQVDGSPLTLAFDFTYNEIALYWTMAVSDQSGVLLVEDIPLVTGNDPACNILKQFAYLKIGSAYVINSSGVTSPDYPNNLNLGTDFILVWGDTPTGEPNPNVVPPVDLDVVVVEFTIPGTTEPWNPADATAPYTVSVAGTSPVLIPCVAGQQILLNYIGGLVTVAGLARNGLGQGTGTVAGGSSWPSDRVAGGRPAGSVGEFLGAFVDGGGNVLGTARIGNGITLPAAPVGTINFSVGVNQAGNFAANSGSWQYTCTYV